MNFGGDLQIITVKMPIRCVNNFHINSIIQFRLCRKYKTPKRTRSSLSKTASIKQSHISAADKHIYSLFTQNNNWKSIRPYSRFPTLMNLKHWHLDSQKLIAPALSLKETAYTLVRSVIVHFYLHCNLQIL